MHPSRCSECGVLSAPPLEEVLDLDLTPGTRHHTLMNTNEPPESSDIPLVLSAISKTDAPLACLDEEISRLQEKLKRLEAERAVLAGYRTRNTAVLSVLRRMPAEVFEEIFSWTLPSTSGALDLGRFDMGASPWVLTRVCSRWRAISLSTPSLWSRVTIDYTTTREPSYPLLLVEAHIQRSQKLKIHFYASPNVDSLPQIQMFELLSQYSSRWEELSIGLTSATVPLLAALRDRVSSLKRVWVQWDGPEGAPVESIDCFQTASSLLDVGAFCKHQFVPMALPMSQLIRYQLSCPWEQHKSILSLAPNLVEARVNIAYDDEPWPDPDQISDLIHLRRLYVSNAEVLNYLKVPVLEELALLVRQAENPDVLQILQTFLDRSPCPLQRLCFHGVPEVHTTSRMLQHLSSITDLAIVIYDANAGGEINDLVSILTVSTFAESTIVAPQLRSLSFACENESYIDYTAYLEMLKSRWEAENCALKNAALLTDSGPGPDSSVLKGLNALRLKGLDLLLLRGDEAGEELRRWSYASTWTWN
ncbi:hypothetical protein B0H19DRAFT_1112346 [Mycena capillaripes]|nr:hypothetical protein B0H19DRAFT_1112346 [Mycena capillaripes]